MMYQVNFLTNRHCALYIENVKTGKRILLHPKGRGSFVMGVRFVDGAGEDTVVDRCLPLGMGRAAIWYSGGYEENYF